MKKNQKGFNVIEGLLILVIFGLIGATGYYVYASQKNANETLDNASKASSTSNVIATKPKAKPETLDIGCTTVSYVPPKGWKVNHKAEEYDDGSRGGYLEFISPDFKTEAVKGSGGLTTVVSGKQFSMYYSDDRNNKYGLSDTKQFIDDLVSGKVNPDFEKSPKGLTIDGQSGVQYFWTPGENGWWMRTFIMYGDGECDLDIKMPSNDKAKGDPDGVEPYVKEPYRSTYENFVKSIEFQ